MCVPGIAFTFSLLKKIKIRSFYKTLIGATVGLISIPLLSFLESNFFNVSFTFQSILANTFLFYAISFIFLYFEFPELFNDFSKVFNHKMHSFTDHFSSNEKLWNFIKANWTILLLLGFMGLAFYVRISTSYAYNFFEFDPVYYNRVTQVLVTQGTIPLVSTDVYYPSNYTLRTYPLVHYIRGSWMLVGNKISGYPLSQEYIVNVSDLYPPLAGAFMSFLLFMIFDLLFYDIVGLIAAILGSMMPQLVTKLAAGVSDLQPYGIVIALFLFVSIALTFKYKSKRLALLSSLIFVSAILGSAQYIWPVAIVGVFTGFCSLIDYWNENLDVNRYLMYAMPVFFGFIAGIILYLNDNGLLLPSSSILHQIPSSFLLLLAVFLFTSFLYLSELVLKTQVKSRSLVTKLVPLIVLILLIIVAGFVSPGITSKVTNYFSFTAGFAFRGSPLAHTIQEEGKTDPSIYPQTFGNIDPILTLMLTAIAICLYSAYNIYKNYNKNAGIAIGVISVLAIILSSQVLSFLSGIIGLFSSSSSAFLVFLSGSIISVFLIITMLILGLDSILTKAENTPLIMLVLSIYPVAFIGTNKLKYLVHFALAICLAIGLGLGIGKIVLDYLTQLFNSESDKKLVLNIIALLVIVIGIYGTYATASTVQTSLAGLASERISADWMDMYSWMRYSPTMSTANCIAEYGYNCRVLSWWDYGHWTTFFGGKQSVLDPLNYYPNYDQEVAKAYVDGNLSDLQYVAKFHEATHIIADAELLQKWGALVYLSGTCSKAESPICFTNTPIPQTANPGTSTYEAEHYFEFLNYAGNCPNSGLGQALPAVTSSITGATYCVSQTSQSGGTLYLLDKQTGQFDPSYQRQWQIETTYPINTSTLNPNVSYLFPYTQGSFVNANPDLSYAGLNNTVFYSAYTRLYLFGDLPGFQLVYNSPTGEVRLFRIEKRFIDGQINTTTAEYPWLANSNSATSTTSSSNVTNSNSGLMIPESNSTNDSVNQSVVAINVNQSNNISINQTSNTTLNA